MGADRFGLHPGYDCGKRRRIRLPDCLKTAKMLQKTPSGTLAYSWNFPQFSGSIPYLAAFAVEGYGESVGFITNQLNQVQYRRVMV
jgi:hypothetical protein